jgi:hypothetical protein
MSLSSTNFFTARSENAKNSLGKRVGCPSFPIFDAWASFWSGSLDLSIHGAMIGDWEAAARYWHGPKTKDIESYVAKVAIAYGFLKDFFDCLLKGSGP